MAGLKYLICLVGMFTVASAGHGQGKYFTRNGVVKFVSDASMEQIEAKNNKVSSALDASTGKIEFIVLIKSFQFEKALMQEHFNESYLESTIYPKATFSGKITNPDVINYSRNGTYKVNVTGNLTMHGVSQNVTATGTIQTIDSNVKVSSVFRVALADYKIKIPSVVKDQIAKEVEIKVDCLLKKV